MIMKSNLKRILSVLIVAVLATVGVAGCALFERDITRYNALVVATVGDDITITKRELIDGFNRFGHRFVSEHNMTLAEAYDQTLDSLIHREVTAKLSANTFGFGEAEQGHITFVDLSCEDGTRRVAVTEREAAQARQVSFDAVNSVMRDLERLVRESRGVPDRITDPVSTDPAPSHPVYTPFQPFMIRNPHTREFSLNTERNRQTQSAVFTPTNENFIESLTELARGASRFEQDVAQETFSRLVLRLENNERGMNFTGADAQPNAVVLRELERIQKEEERNILVRRMQTAFEHGIASAPDFARMLELRDGGAIINANGERTTFDDFIRDLSQNTVNDLARRATEQYIMNVNMAIDRFERGFDTRDSFYERMLGSLDGLWFVPESVADQFFTVSHVLVGFTPEQQAELTRIEERFQQDRNEVNRDRAINNLRDSVRIHRRNEQGVPIGNPMSATQVLDFVEARVMPNNASKPLDRKLSDFQDMIYMFGSDPGMFNPEFEYVIGRDRREDRSLTSQEHDTMSQMVPEFTAAARELFQFCEIQGRGLGTLGSMSGLVWTSHGAHILMFTRNISDFIFTNSVTKVNHTFENILHAPRVSYGVRTAFDVLVDGLTRPMFAQHESNLVNSFKDQNEVVIHQRNFRDLRNGRA